METPPLVRARSPSPRRRGSRSRASRRTVPCSTSSPPAAGWRGPREIGTGAGVGAAWIVSALQPQVPFFTAELDPDLAARAAELFADDPNVVVLAGPWRASLPVEAPFDLLFVDAHDAKDDVEAVVGLLAPGGTAVLDDFWNDPALPDPRRDAWLQHPLLTAIELWVTPERRALVAVRG